MKNFWVKIGETLGIVGIVVLAIVMIIVGPLIGVWAINTLFHTNTEYTFWTWLAALLFFGLVKTTTE
jgi:hypothetical protein